MFEFAVFDLTCDKLKDSISKLGAFKVSSVANVRYGLQRFYQNKDPVSTD